MSTLDVTISYKRWHQVRFTRFLRFEPLTLSYSKLPPIAPGSRLSPQPLGIDGERGFEDLTLQQLLPQRLFIIGVFILTLLGVRRVWGRHVPSARIPFVLVPVYLELLNSHLTVTFTRPLHPDIPIQRVKRPYPNSHLAWGPRRGRIEDGDFRGLLEGGGYRAMYNSLIHKDLYGRYMALVNLLFPLPSFPC